ncbi:MAG: 2,3-bisphosphoglycerate-independent phosphoglycerate mutase [Synergistaceae bacterium]|nr:2,3-bisphosphoglycerate-independent phosphoglycerate mutase [Synergistaceae bacterium]
MNKRMEMLKNLSVENDCKIVLLVMDGLGGLPDSRGKTELEAAHSPNLDSLAERSELGFLNMVDVGITPGSGPGHLSLFGYDPSEYIVGRGILEACGVGAKVSRGDICVRGNFCTCDGDLITDRRAGRIPTEQSAKVVLKLAANIKEIEDVKTTFYPGMEHRFVVVFSGGGLDEHVHDADPQKEGVPMLWASAVTPQGQRMADIANKFIVRVQEVLKDDKPANSCLLRGFSSAPDIPQLGELYKIKAAALATYPMYRGLASLVGMEIEDAGKTLEDLFDSVKKCWDKHNYFYVHVKYTDSRGEDGKFDEKVKVIEQVDSLLPKITSLNPDVLVVTGDHSTPAVMKAHSWHDVPFMISSNKCRFGLHKTFGENECRFGTIGHISGYKLIGLMLAHAEKLNKFGA